jgi:DNA-binding transcriptional LysR family regulator
VALTLDQPPMELPGVFAVYASTRRPPAKVRAFIDFLARRFGSGPPWDHDLSLPKQQPIRPRSRSQ